MSTRQIRSLFTGRHERETRTLWLTEELREKDRLFNIPVKNFLTKELENIGNERILDVGSGVFADTYLPDNRIKQTTKTDFVEIDDNDQNIININADDLSGIFGEESFGVVIMKQVYTHLVDPNKSLGEIRKVLKKQGMFILIDWEKASNSPSERKISDDVPEMMTDFNSDEMLEKFEEFGFKPIKKQILLEKPALDIPYNVLLTAVTGRKI